MRIINLSDIFPANLFAMNKLYLFGSWKSLCAGLTALTLCLFAAPISAQTIPTPTQTDEIIIDNGTSGKADPNDRIRYKVTIQNTGGADATGTQLNITPDPRTTLVPGSFRSSPLAVPDAYACTGNVPISVPAANGLKANDFDDNLVGATITAGTFATTQGGSIVIAADGGFSYTPPAGFTNSTDTYSYTLNDGNGVGGGVPATDMAVVTFTVSNLIWFIDNSSMAATSDGRRNSPFKLLTSFNSGSTAAADVVYLEHTGTNYSGGIVLDNTERLFGEGHTGGTTLADVLPFTLAPFSVALPAINGSRPVITNAGGDGVTLAMNNNLRGLNIADCTDFAIENIGTSSVGDLVVSEVSINNTTGGGFKAGNGSGASMNVVFNSLSSSGGTNGINLANCGGTFIANGGSITNPSGTGVNISGGTVAVDYDGSVSKNNEGNLIFILAHTTGNITFDGNLFAINGNAASIVVQSSTNSGVISFNGASKNFTVASGTAIILRNNSGTTINFAGGGLVLNATTTGSGIEAQNSGTLNVTGSGNMITTISGIGIDILNTNAGVGGIHFVYIISTSGQIATIGASTGTKIFERIVTSSGTTTALNLDNAGTVQIGNNSLASSLSTTTATCVTVNASTLNLIGLGLDVTTTGTGIGVRCTGGTVNITGGNLEIVNSSSGIGFLATSGGTVSVQGTGNTISSITGTALNVANTTIGAGGLTFQSIASNGGSATGIILDNTGASGGLTVTGSGTPGSGGTIANKTGTNGSNTTGVGIYLNNCSQVSLTRMQLNNFTNFGIRGFNVNNFTLDNSVVNHSSGKNGDDAATDEGSIYFGAENPGGSNGLTGTVNITNCLIEDGYENNFKIANLSGTLSQFTMSGTTIRDNSNVSPGNNGFEIRAQGTANITADITTSTFTGNRANGIQVTTTPEHTGTVDVEIGISGVAGSGGTFTNNNIGINIGHGSAGILNFDIHRGVFNSSPGLASPININLAAGGGGPMSGSITNNTITNANSPTGPGIRVNTNGTDANASNVLTILVSNNNISQIANRGIEMIARDGNSTINATITNNTVNLTDGLAGDAIRVDAGTTATDVTTINAHIAGNTATTIAGQFGVRVRQRFVGTTYRLQGYGGSATDDAAVAAFLAMNNGGATTSADHGGAGFLNIVLVPLP